MTALAVSKATGCSASRQARGGTVERLKGAYSFMLYASMPTKRSGTSRQSRDSAPSRLTGTVQVKFWNELDFIDICFKAAAIPAPIEILEQCGKFNLIYS